MQANLQRLAPMKQVIAEWVELGFTDDQITLLSVGYYVQIHSRYLELNKFALQSAQNGTYACWINDAEEQAEQWLEESQNCLPSWFKQSILAEPEIKLPGEETE